MDLTSTLRRNGRIVTTADIDKTTLSNAVRRGTLVRLYPRTYVATAALGDLSAAGQHLLRCTAALRYAGPTGVISHRSALDVLGLTASYAAAIHVTIPRGLWLASSPRLVVHHGCVHGIRRRGLSVSPVPRAIVESWPDLTTKERIDIAIQALNRGDATLRELETCLAEMPRLPGRQELRRILGLFAAGCRSPLEIWGATGVFTGAVLSRLERQVRVRVGKRTYHLDLFHRVAMVAFELDGAAFHGSKTQRERDLRRDADLASVGILVVRFSYDRLMSDPSGVRKQAMMIIRSRLSMIG